MGTVDYEVEIQKFICDYPWLLNINYQNIPELKDKLKDNYAEMELHIEGNKRIDLILKDTSTGFPVIVEFKRDNLERETIGQILEYRARVTASLNDKNKILYDIFGNKQISPKTISEINKILYDIFGNKLLAPKMVIVVRESDELGKIACHLQNIDLIEYGNFKTDIIKNKFDIKEADAFSETLKKITPYLSPERDKYLNVNVISVLKEIFKDNGIENKLCNYKYCEPYSFGDYWNYNSMFLNKYILQEEYHKISIYIYEDIFHKENMPVCICYYSKLEEKLKELEKLLLKNENNICFAHDIEIEYNENDITLFYLKFWYKSEDFYKDVKEILKFNIEKYLEYTKLCENEH